MIKFKHFDLNEREKIERFLKKGKSMRWIAWLLDRSISSVSDEVKRNSVKGRYIGKKAEHKAYVKRGASKSRPYRRPREDVLKADGADISSHPQGRDRDSRAHKRGRS